MGFALLALGESGGTLVMNDDHGMEYWKFGSYGYTESLGIRYILGVLLVRAFVWGWS